MILMLSHVFLYFQAKKNLTVFECLLFYYILLLLLLLLIFLLAHIRLAVIILVSQHISSFCERGITKIRKLTLHCPPAFFFFLFMR